MGTWDPEHAHASIPADLLAEGKRWALKKHAAASHGPGTADAHEGTRASHGHCLREQRAYVSLTDDQKGRLRRWDVEPTALPPHPCMLCDAAYGTEGLLSQHIEEKH